MVKYDWQSRFIIDLLHRGREGKREEVMERFMGGNLDKPHKAMGSDRNQITDWDI